MTRRDAMQPEKKEELLEIISSKIQSGRIATLQPGNLAKEFGISRQTIYHYKKQLLKKTKSEDSGLIKSKFNPIYDRLLQEAEFSLALAKQSKNVSAINKSIQTYLQVMNETTRFLEDYGMKPRAPEFHYHNNTDTNGDKKIDIEVVSVESKFDEDDEEEDE